MALNLFVSPSSFPLTSQNPKPHSSSASSFLYSTLRLLQFSKCLTSLSPPPATLSIPQSQNPNYSPPSIHNHEDEDYESQQEQQLVQQKHQQEEDVQRVCRREIRRLARDVPEDSKLGEFLGSYVGKIEGSSCIMILESFKFKCRGKSCLDFYEWMGSQEPSLVSPKACSIVFTTLGWAGMGEKIMGLFRNLPHGERYRNVFVYNTAISGLVSCGRYVDAWEVYKEMDKNDIQPNHMTFAILITLLRKSGRSADEAWEFFERTNKDGFKWSLEVFSVLIKSFFDEGLVKEAHNIQPNMEKIGSSSDATVYNNLMDAYAKDCQIEEAEGLLMEMKEKGVKPTSYFYETLMNMYSRMMMPEKLIALFRKLPSERKFKTVYVYNMVLLSMLSCGRFTDAWKVYKEMETSNIQPDGVTCSILVTLMRIRGCSTEDAWEFVERMKRKGVKWSLEGIGALIKSFGDKGLIRQTLVIQSDRENNCSP